MRHPTGWSRWTHHEEGGEYIFLTEAGGLDEEGAEEFAYFLWIDPATGVHKARVCRMSTWHAIMRPHPTAESEYDRRTRELQAEADTGPWYLHHPESDCVWEETDYARVCEALDDGLTVQVDKDAYEMLRSIYDDNDLDELI